MRIFLALENMKIKIFSMEAGAPVVVLNAEDARDAGLYSKDRVKITTPTGSIIAIVDITKTMLKQGEVGVFLEIKRALDLKEGQFVSIVPVMMPRSLEFIKKKMQGKKLEPAEIREIVEDVVLNKLSESEISAFLTSVYIYDLDLSEIESLARAIAETGERLEIKKHPIFDKHSIGGVAGNKISLLIVPIVAAAGLTIPKTSSRAITSASVIYDTPVLISKNGEVKLEKIGPLVDKILLHNPHVVKIGDAEYCNVQNGLKVFGFDNYFKIRLMPIKGVYRHPVVNKELFLIRLATGRKVVVTEDHSLFVVKEGKIVSLPSKDLKRGDFVIVPRVINGYHDKFVKKINLIEKFTELLPERELNDIFITEVAKYFRKELKEFARQRGWTNNAYYDRNTTPLNVFKAKKIKSPLLKTKIKCKYGVAIPSVIRVTPQLIKILGYFAAEGRYYIGNGNYAVTFYLGYKEQALAKEIKDCIEKAFGLNAKIRRRHSEIDIIVRSKVLAYVFKYVFKTGNTAHTKKVPNLIFNISPRLQKDYIMAYLRGDGSLQSKKYRKYEAKSVSKEFVQGIWYLASLLGIPYSIGEKPAGRFRHFPSYVSKLSHEYIAYFYLRDKYEKHSTAHINVVPFSAFSELRRYAKYPRQKAISFSRASKFINNSSCGEVVKFLNGDLGLLRVRSIKRVSASKRHSYVYDFCVNPSENFVGGTAPICLHNSGTADIMEVLAPVDLTIKEIQEIVEKVNGVIVWGGAVNLAPADDIFIRMNYPFAIDPRGQTLASVLAKKYAVGAEYVVIDIPTGPSAKVENMDEAKKLARDFVDLGERLGMHVECAITYGGQPLGRAIGPALEAREALRVLYGSKSPASLIEKATAIAGILLELGGKAPKGQGQNLAKEILHSGKALEKMKQIIRAQGGNPEIKPEDVQVGNKTATFCATADGYVTHIDNKLIIQIARAVGAPKDKGAGLILKVKRGRRVVKGNPLLEIHAESESKLTSALNLAQKIQPMRIEGMLLKRIPEIMYVEE